MADVKWIKLSVGMFEDEKIRLIESLPESDTILIIWVKLLAQAGKTNASGYIYLNERIPFTDEMLATIFNRPLGTVRLALKTFEQFGMIEINDDNFIAIANWEKHQNIDGLEKIRQQTKKRVAEHRKKKKEELPKPPCNVTVTRGNATDIELDKERDIEKEKEKQHLLSVDDFYQNNFGVLNPFIAESLSHWVRDLNEELVIEAMKRALAQQKKWKYAEGILKNWVNQNIRSLADVQALDKQFENRKPSISKRSIFEQGEESKKRQAAIKPMSPEEAERLRRMEEEMPF